MELTTLLAVLFTETNGFLKFIHILELIVIKHGPIECIIIVAYEMIVQYRESFSIVCFTIIACHTTVKYPLNGIKRFVYSTSNEVSFRDSKHLFIYLRKTKHITLIVAFSKSKFFDKIG